jgi:hypothetical protein
MQFTENSVQAGGSGAFLEAAWSDTVMNLPVKSRYTTALIVQLKQRNLRREVLARGVLWLKDLVDGESIDVDIPMFAPGEGKTSQYDQIPTSTPLDLRSATKEYLQFCMEREPELIDRFVGHLRMTVCFYPGVSDGHRKKSTQMRCAVEVNNLVRDERLSPVIQDDIYRYGSMELLDDDILSSSSNSVDSASEYLPYGGSDTQLSTFYPRQSVESSVSLSERLDDAVNKRRSKHWFNMAHERTRSFDSSIRRKTLDQLSRFYAQWYLTLYTGD